MTDDKSREGKKKEPKKGTAKPKAVVVAKEQIDIEEFDESVPTVSLFVAIGLVISALVVGLIIGYVAAPKGIADNINTTPPVRTTAPSLSEDQIKSGQLPANHPPISNNAASGTATTQTPSEGGAGSTTGTP